MLTEIRISRSALTHNVAAFRRVIGPQLKLMAVVKSNAYGHGVGECTSILQSTSVDWYGVASVTEALPLAKKYARTTIMALSFVDVADLNLGRAIRLGVRLPAYTLAMLERYNRVARKVRRRAVVHLKLDTGTTRVGFLEKQLPEVIRILPKFSHLDIEGVYSHFAEVESAQQRFSQLQHEHFTRLARTLEQHLGRKLLKHMDCSAGVLVHPDAHFDMVRVGMSLYGIWTVADSRRVHRTYPWFHLKPALHWVTSLIQVKAVPAGTTVGYNRTFLFRRAGRIGVLPVGYWDGLDRKLSNRGFVRIQGKRAPIRGRVCMNLTMVDLSAFPNAREGDVVTLLGPGIPAEVLAHLNATIPYEIFTRLNPTIPRRIVS